MADDTSLEQLLARMNVALAKTATGLVQQPAVPERPAWPLLMVALVVGAAGVAAGSPVLLVAAGAGLAWETVRHFRLGMRRPVRGDFPHIGLGAAVAKGAQVEPGAVIEMGADICEGAVIKSGAVVKMGATVGRNAVIEAGAVVSWGAEVHEGARVGEGAVVGAGADVAEGAEVPAGMRLMPGADYGASGDPDARDPMRDGARPALAPAAGPPQLRPADPREARLASICDRLDAELRASPEAVRELLGAPGTTLGALRSTCLDLLRREADMRLESAPESLARLAAERAALQDRIARAADERIRRSLEGAVAAIDEQQSQRELLRLGADRLEAEATRLLYTLEGLGSLFARLRTAGKEARSAPTAELERGVAELKSELDAVAGALEEVSARPPQRVR